MAHGSDGAAGSLTSGLISKSDLLCCIFLASRSICESSSASLSPDAILVAQSRERGVGKRCEGARRRTAGALGLQSACAQHAAGQS